MRNPKSCPLHSRRSGTTHCKWAKPSWTNPKPFGQLTTSRKQVESHVKGASDPQLIVEVCEGPVRTDYQPRVSPICDLLIQKTDARDKPKTDNITMQMSFTENFCKCEVLIRHCSLRIFFLSVYNFRSFGFNFNFYLRTRCSARSRQ